MSIESMYKECLQGRNWHYSYIGKKDSVHSTWINTNPVNDPAMGYRKMYYHNSANIFTTYGDYRYRRGKYILFNKPNPIWTKRERKAALRRYQWLAEVYDLGYIIDDGKDFAIHDEGIVKVITDGLIVQFQDNPVEPEKDFFM